MSIYGNPVMLGGSGGGGGDVPMLTQAQWDALSEAQKQTYGYVAIQKTDSGYQRGSLVYGAAYSSFVVYQSGFGGASSASVTLEHSGSQYLMVIAMNSEATTRNLTVGATLNGNALTGESIAYNQYQSSGENRRNYRVMLFALTGTIGDTIAITLTDRSNFSGFVYALFNSPYLIIDKQMSTPDNVTVGANSVRGMVAYGIFNSSNNGSINLELYTAGDTVNSGNPGSSYKSSYIFWFV